MRLRMIGTAAALVAALLATGTAGAQGGKASNLGDWKTEGGQATVRIGPCRRDPRTICGNFIDLAGDGRTARDKNNPNAGLRSRPLLGMPFVTGFRPAGADRWRGGKIYNPQNGKTYSAKMDLNPNRTLTVSGCVLFFCEGETWTRAR